MQEEELERIESTNDVNTVLMCEIFKKIKKFLKEQKYIMKLLALNPETALKRNSTVPNPNI